jgi:hypothetical protein
LVTQRAKQRSSQDRPKINFTHQAITERNPQAVRTDNLEILDAMKGVNHVGTYGSGSLGKGSERKS